MNFLYSKTPLKFFIQNVNHDEAFSYLLAHKGIFEIITLSAQNGNPPLYYLILRLWMGIFGTSEVAMRSLSLLCFMGIAYFVYDFLTEVCNLDKKRSLWYLLLIFGNPFLSYYAFEAGPYAMIAFFATASCYAFHVGKKRLYLMSTLLGLYTHYFMIFIVSIQAIFILLTHRKLRGIYDEMKKIALPIVAWMPWFIFMVIQKKGSIQPLETQRPIIKDLWYMLAIQYTAFEKTLRNMPSDYTVLVRNLAIVLIMLFSIGGVYIYLKNKHSKRIATFLALWTFLPPLIIFIVSFFTTSFYTPKLLIISTPALLLLLIYIMEAIPAKARIVSLVVLTILTVQYQNFQITYRTKTEIKTVLQQLKAIAKPQDVLYVTNYLDFHVAQYYFGEEKVFMYGEQYANIPHYEGKILIPEEKMTHIYPVHPQKAFIYSNQKYYSRSQY